jgi:integrase
MAAPYVRASAAASQRLNLPYSANATTQSDCRRLLLRAGREPTDATISGCSFALVPARKKRDDGDGSAYQLSDGRWRAEVTIGWERLSDGRKKRVRRYVYGATEAQAKLERRQLLIKREQGELPIGDQVTVRGWVTYWLDEIAVHRNKAKTIESYRTLIDRWIVPTIGDVRLRSLQPEHVEQLHAAMRAGREHRQVRKDGTERVTPARPLAASTILQAHHVLSRALKVAHQRGKVKRNVASLVDAPSVAGRRAEHYLQRDQAREFLRAVEDRWNGARWSAALAVGLRQGEALGLLWDLDVDLGEGVVRVQRQLQRRRGGTLELVPYPKTKSGRRAIALPPPLAAVLRRHRAEQQQTRAALDEWRGHDDLPGLPAGAGLVFCTRLGRALEPRADYEEWRSLLAVIGADAIPQHASRHTAATLMLQQGIDPKVVSAILGHASMQITRDLYQHITPELARDAADLMGDALWPEG